VRLKTCVLAIVITHIIHVFHFSHHRNSSSRSSCSAILDQSLLLLREERGRALSRRFNVGCCNVNVGGLVDVGTTVHCTPYHYKDVEVECFVI